MSSIPTRRHVEYARGYLALGMLSEARAELDSVKAGDQDHIEVRHAWVDLHMEAKAWKKVVATARPLCELAPQKDAAWIAWAFALRELQQVQEAQEVLQKAEPLHGSKCAVLHYNLACYACLLGDKKEARRRLARACKMDQEWKAIALEDSDLQTMWDEIAKM